jgi:DNA mismatch repair ATPase MutS
MSGKSTWLRSIGINLVLAYAGSPVCAEKFVCSVMDIYTSMEIRDDLIEGVSTFYAELKRINMILEHSRRDKPMIYLIDEIFRGTNSLDRITGAQVVLRQLSQNGAIGLISTHDFELCDLEKELWAKFKNFHFQEHYVNGGIEFDYKLRPGRCSTSNARYLMKMVGIDIS